MVTLMDVSHYRRAYFALAKSLGIDDDLRHDFNRAQVGKESTRDFAVDDWRHVVAEMQRLAGQDVQPGRPHLKGRGDEGANVITPAQLERLHMLAAQVRWRAGVHDWVRSRMSPLRRQTWDGHLDTLLAVEARSALAGLRRMTAQSRRRATAKPAQRSAAPLAELDCEK